MQSAARSGAVVQERVSAGNVVPSGGICSAPRPHSPAAPHPGEGSEGKGQAATHNGRGPSGCPGEAHRPSEVLGGRLPARSAPIFGRASTLPHGC